MFLTSFRESICLFCNNLGPYAPLMAMVIICLAILSLSRDLSSLDDIKTKTLNAKDDFTEERKSTLHEVALANVFLPVMLYSEKQYDLPSKSSLSI